MKLTIPKHNLATSLRRVQGAISGRATNAALGGVLLRATDGLQAMATNLDLQISHKTEATVIEPGAALLPFAALNQHVTNFGPQDVEMAVDDKFRCTLVCGDSRGSLSGMDPKEFTEFPQQERKGFTMAQADLKAALRKTLIAVSTDETRFTLNGVLVELLKNRLTIVACDGRRISLVKQLFDGDDISAIVPTRGAAEAMRLLTEDGEVAIAIGKASAEFSIGSSTVTSKVIDGGYPNYKPYFPEKFTHHVPINRDELLAAAKYVAWITEQNLLPITDFQFTKNKLVLDQKSQNNEARRELLVSYDGPDMLIRLAPEQVMAILSVLTEDDVTIEFTDDLSPVVVKAGNFIGMVFPLRPIK